MGVAEPASENIRRLSGDRENSGSDPSNQCDQTGPGGKRLELWASRLTAPISAGKHYEVIASPRETDRTAHINPVLHGVAHSESIMNGCELVRREAGRNLPRQAGKETRRERIIIGL